MKRKLSIFLFTMIAFCCINAEQKDVIINPTNTSQNGDSGNHPRSPIRIPNVTIDGYVLTFDSFCVNCSIQLLQDDIVIWSGAVDENGEVVLPDYLIGTYTLQFQLGSITFFGEISL